MKKEIEKHNPELVINIPYTSGDKKYDMNGKSVSALTNKFRKLNSEITLLSSKLPNLSDAQNQKRAEAKKGLLEVQEMIDLRIDHLNEEQQDRENYNSLCLPGAQY